MFDETYFRTTFPRDVAATGGHPVVEVQLISGHAHRVSSIAEIGSGTVTLETYVAKGDLTHERPHFDEPKGDGLETFRAIVSYESIAAVILDPSRSPTRARPGFAST